MNHRYLSYHPNLMHYVVILGKKNALFSEPPELFFLVSTKSALCTIEKRRRIRRQESDGDGGAGEKKERKTKAEVVG